MKVYLAKDRVGIFIEDLVLVTMFSTLADYCLGSHHTKKKKSSAWISAPPKTHPTHRILLFLKTHGQSEGSRPRYIQQCLCPAAFPGCGSRLFVCAMYTFVVAAVLLFATLDRSSVAIDAPDCSRTVSIRWSRTSDR